MKSEVFMVRNLEGIEVRQSNQTEMFNVTDLVNGFNETRRARGLPTKDLREYWKNEATKEFIQALEKQSGEFPSLLKKVCRGKLNKGTWVHPAIFVDIAMWLNPEFKAKVMMWLADNLLGLRNGSAESYKKMTRAIYYRLDDKTEQQKLLATTKIANLVKEKIGVEDWNLASTEQLDMRDRLHNRIKAACDFLPESVGFNELCKRVFKEEN